jgi:hypothetical protein
LEVKKPTFQVILTLCRLSIAWFGLLLLPDDLYAQRSDTTRVNTDTTRTTPYRPSRRPTFNPTDRYGDPFSNTTYESPLFQDPNQLKLDVEIDTSLNYTIYEKMGDVNYRPASTMSFEEFNH